MLRAWHEKCCNHCVKIDAFCYNYDYFTISNHIGNTQRRITYSHLNTKTYYYVTTLIVIYVSVKYWVCVVKENKNNKYRICY